MKTVAIYPVPAKRAEAYVELDSGELWGPLWPFDPRLNLSPVPQPAELRTRQAGESLTSWARKLNLEYVNVEPALNAGEHYPRIWRTAPELEYHGDPLPKVEDTAHFEAFVQSLQQTELLFQGLADIFRVLQPTGDNLKAFGGAIRDVIILACTEVEAQWKAVLTAHAAQPMRDRFTTADYVKLHPVMKLDGYRVKLNRYPGLNPSRPFALWESNRPTQSLVWYDTYNKVKHDRESHFKDANSAMQLTWLPLAL